MLADGVDEDTWNFHLRRGEYSTWFRTYVKDPELAAIAQQIETDTSLNAQASRARIRDEISKRYTLPADEASGVIDAEDSSTLSTRPSA
jgi:hypothetical protein